MEELLRPQDVSPGCFLCGTENPHGLKLRFTRLEDGSVTTTVTPREHWTGFGRILHGGFQGMLLDEIMSWAVWGSGERHFVTQSMNIVFHAPVHVGQELTLVGRVCVREANRLQTEGELRDAEGRVLTSSEGVIALVDPERMKGMMQA